MKKRLTTEEFIKRSKEIHGEKYDYSKVIYTISKNKVIIICPIHGEFLQSAGVHIQKCGCPFCKKLLIKNKNEMKINEFIFKSKKIHNKLYDYSKSIITGSHNKLIIICKKHGQFLQSPTNHLCGKGCPKCQNEKTGNRCRKSIQNFILECNKIHNSKYDYSQTIYKNNITKIKIICPKHGLFLQLPRAHLYSKQGCPKCNLIISKKEEEFLNYLNLPNNENHRQVKILRKRIDGYDPKTNTIYEFLGDYWHGNPDSFNKEKINWVNKKTFGELYENTFKKFDKLKSFGYNIKYIWENDWNKFKNDINKEPKILTY